MTAQAESQTGAADNEANPLIPPAFENDHVLSATEAIMWLVCRRRFSHDTISEHLRQRTLNLNRQTGGILQVGPALHKRTEEAGRKLIGLMIGGVPATGTLVDEGHPDHGKRVPVSVPFLKDGAFIELLSSRIRADPLLEKHRGNERPKYYEVDIDRDDFFKALATAERKSQATAGGNEQDKMMRTARRPEQDNRVHEVVEDIDNKPRRGRVAGQGAIDDTASLLKMLGLLTGPTPSAKTIHAAATDVANDLVETGVAGKVDSHRRRLEPKFKTKYGTDYPKVEDISDAKKS